MKRILLFFVICGLMFITACKDKETEKAVVKETFLKIGQKATIENEIGKYEVKVDTVMKPLRLNETEPKNETFVIINTTYKNLSEKPIEIRKINNAKIVNENEKVGNLTDTKLINLKDGELAPGQEITRSMLFDYKSLDSYILEYDSKVIYKLKIPKQEGKK